MMERHCEPEERNLFPTLEKPLNGLVECLMLIYTAESMAPDDREKSLEYWHRELGKTWAFLMKHERKYLSYLHEKEISDMPIRHSPQSDETLKSMILVRERYMTYIEAKLELLRGRRQNSFLLRA